LSQIKNHIFIGGCSRSGTTLLGAMLGANPDTICVPESHFKIDVLRKLWPHHEAIDVGHVLGRLVKHWRFKIWGLDATPADLRPLVDGTRYGDLLHAMVAAYAQTENKPTATTWLDHTPENVSYANSLLTLYPDARFIHIVRDGRAVAASILPLDWGPNSVIKAARWWMRMVSFGLAAESVLSPEQIIRVRYEDLVLHPEETLQTLCQFLGIDYLPQMLDATGFRPPRYTNQQHTLIGRSANSAAINRWQERLSPRDIEIFENLTRDFLVNLGYDPLYGLQAKPPNFLEIQSGKAVELIRGEIVNKIKWLVRSYPLWLSPDFYAFARLADSNN
jgi:hypothetical protein